MTHLSDPSISIVESGSLELDDQIPILLLPVRLETRFRTVRDGASADELWIRIYPDDCQIDTFEALLTNTEVENARAFWVAMWRAGGVDDQRRGAWRSLIGGSSTGRAAYVISQYAPTNPTDEPKKVSPQDVVLVIVPEIVVSDAERAAAFTYWTAVWRANGDATREASAFSALAATVGAARANAIQAQFAPRPEGQDPPAPFTRNDVNVTCAVLELPPPPATKATSWTQAPRAAALPDRFVALLFNGGLSAKPPILGNPILGPVATGPDPSLPKAQQIQIVNDDLVLNDDLRWLGDFERAFEVGMAIKVPLTAAEAGAGFDRLIVLGLRLSSDPTRTAAEVETLFQHHAASKGGIGLVRQGSPAHNTDASGSAHTWIDDPDAAFDSVFEHADAYVPTSDAFERRDGEWLARALGLSNAFMSSIPGAAERDQGEARAMNTALWPATGGYAMEEMMRTLFAPADVDATRRFFTQFVSGRGPLPALRIGVEPYGILPAVAFSDFRPTTREPAVFDASYLARLHALLVKMSATWATFAASASHVGAAGDPQQLALDILGLCPGSVEYHQRYAESLDQLYNKLVIQRGPGAAATLATWLRARRRDALTETGAPPDLDPPLTDRFFYEDETLLTGPVVDDVPLSETAPVRAYASDGKNYLAWLATSSLDAIRREDFGGEPEPIALLYLFLRHAMMLGSWDAATRALETRNLVAPDARREPSFIHVESAASGGVSKFQPLYAPRPEITGDNTTLLGDWVLTPSVLATQPETIDLGAQIAALRRLEDTPTARLERLFAEHIDTMTYRIDAWRTALAAVRLEEMRVSSEGRSGARLYVGAFGFLEELRPKSTPLTRPELDPDLAAVFQRPNDASLASDPANEGYIQAPSLAQATAAAVLENGYRVNASACTPDRMSVDLSSARVREALAILEGVRLGQTLGAVLGYRFERDLHDAYALAEVDKFIYPLRLAFPLVANNIASTTDSTADDITLLEARNVIDGLKLIQQIGRSGEAGYPFGLALGTGPGQLPAATAQEASAIDTAVKTLLDVDDALADLVLAEGVYQSVLGNFDRASAVTTAISEGHRPPDVHVVDTPRSGRSLTHRVALHLDPSIDPNAPLQSIPMTPRARVEAPLNAWISGRLPAPADVVVFVTYASPVLAAPKSTLVSQADLALQAIDLLHLTDAAFEQAMSALDDRILQLIRYGSDAHPDLSITIEYTHLVPGKVTLFELSALMRSVRRLVRESRALRPSDMAQPLDAKVGEGAWDDGELRARVQRAIDDLVPIHTMLAGLASGAADFDDYVRQVSDAFLAAALFGVQQAGTAQIHAAVRGIYADISGKVERIVARWTDKAAAYDALLATLLTLTTNADRIVLLAKAEGQIASSTTTPLPTDAINYRTAVEAKKARFDVHLAAFRALLAFSTGRLEDFRSAVAAMSPIASEHDAIPFEIADETAAIESLESQVASRVAVATAEVAQRIADAQAALAAVTSDDVESLIAVAKKVFGDDIQVIPRFRLDAQRGLEIKNCLADSAVLLTDLVASGRRFPIDDWLYGVARVRPKLTAWENVALLADAFLASTLDLTPLQLPYRPNDRWCALEFDTASVTGDRLLYTAHFSAAFDPAGVQCGVFVDEWPEVVPSEDLVSGVAFHFDRPSAQPPQSMLLVVPSELTGRWRWSDIVGALNDVLDSAKTRCVEPAQIDDSMYAQFLPATLMAVTLYQITISTNLGLNNRIYDRIEA
jgi:hypothetical protein